MSNQATDRDRGKQMNIQNSHLIADDLGTVGVFPKAWIRKGSIFSQITHSPCTCSICLGT